MQVLRNMPKAYDGQHTTICCRLFSLHNDVIDLHKKRPFIWKRSPWKICPYSIFIYSLSISTADYLKKSIQVFPGMLTKNVWCKFCRNTEVHTLSFGETHYALRIISDDVSLLLIRWRLVCDGGMTISDTLIRNTFNRFKLNRTSKPGMYFLYNVIHMFPPKYNELVFTKLSFSRVVSISTWLFSCVLCDC